MIKRMLNKYSLVFLIIAISLLLGSSLVAASDIDNGGVLDDTNIIECDDTPSIVQDDNTNSRTVENEVMTDDDKTDTTTSRELTKNNKNLKGVNYPGTLTMNASSGYPGDVVELKLFHTAQLPVASDYTYNVTLNDTLYQSGALEISENRYAFVNFTVPAVDAGEYILKISVSHRKNMFVLGSDYFTVLKSTSSLTIENETVIQGNNDNFILPVNIRDADGNAVDVETNLTITDGDNVLVENYHITQADNNIPVPVIRTGEYSLTVIIDATDDYSESTCLIPVNVVDAESILKTRIISDELPIAVRVTETFTIKGKLVDETDKSIADADILIIVNGEEFTTTTDDEGVYSYDYYPTGVSENNLYEVRYFGDLTHDLARNYVGSFFDVEKASAVITVNVSDSSVNNPTSITGTVTDSNDNPLANVDVKVIVNNDALNTTTDSQGLYEVVYTPTKTGNYEVTATVNDENYNSKVATATFNVTKADTTTTINPVIIATSYDVNLTANVVDSNNNPVTSGKVVFKVNGKTVKDENGKVIYIKVNDGTAVLSHSFTQDDIDKNASISASYSGTTNYASSTSSKVFIEKADNNVLMTLDDVTAEAGEVITPTVAVKYNDENVDGGKVVFKINGKTIKDDTGKVIYANVIDGVATCEYTLPATMKAKNYTLSAVFTNSLYNRTEAKATLEVVESNAVTNLSGNGKSHLMGDGEPKTIIINNDTIATYITDNGLTDLVAEGDTLDFQGTISGVDGLTTIIIDKPVNIITSTNDGRIELFNNITYTRQASGSNVTGLFTFNTQFYVVNADNMVFDNISNVVDNKGIGSQVGQTSIRNVCTNITVKNSLIKTINNGGFSSLVFTYVSHSYVLNNTIIGEGRVGNLFYFNTYNAGSESNEGNSYNVVANNTIIGPDEESSICYGVQMLAGVENLIENNTIYYTGYTLRGGSSDTIIRNNVIYGGKSDATGIITNNTLYNNGSITANKNSVVENNTIYGTLNVSTNSIVRNNVAGNLIIGDNTTVSNVTITGNVSYVTDSTVSDSVLENSTISGNILISTAAQTAVASRNKIRNNNIGGNITIIRSNYAVIANNTINGTINVTATKAGNTLITENNITTDNEYTIINYNETTTISNNQLITPTALGNSTINDISANATIINNGPAYKVNITMDTY
ncbi:MAG: hypothetical protein BZ137_00840, partial [Methanosphaera sp. rholeuAM130]